jgi:hypothetical protein
LTSRHWIQRISAGINEENKTVGKLLTRLVGFIVVILVAHYFLKGYVLERVSDHFNSCHDQLHIATRLRSADSQELDKILAEYRECVVNKTTFLDGLFFGKNDIDTAMDAMRLMNRK